MRLSRARSPRSAWIGLAAGLVMLAAGATSSRAQPDGTGPGLRLDCNLAEPRVARLVGDQHYVDAHLAAVAADVLCPAEGVPGWRLWDAVALVRIEEYERARGALAELAVVADVRIAERARVIAAWSLLQARDQRAFRAMLPRLPVAPRMRLDTLAVIRDGGDVGRATRRLDADLRAAVDRTHADYRARRGKRPWLAGTLSAVVPGLGQVYAGSWEGAAVAFVLNGVLISSTVELARHRLYFASATTGLAASVFYVGNILNAADLARRRNDRSSEAAAASLERLLVPEVWPD